MAPDVAPLVSRPFWGCWRRAARFVLPYRRTLAAVGLLSVLTSGLLAVEPLITKRLFDEIEGPRHKWVLGGALASLCFVLALREALMARLDEQSWKVRLNLNVSLTRATAERLHTLPLSFHRQETVGGLITKMNRGIDGSVTAFSEVAFTIFPAVVYLIVSVTIMVRLDPFLALLVVLFAPIAPLIGARAAREQATRERTLTARWTKIYARFNEVLSSILAVKAFAVEDVEKRRFLQGFEEATDIVYRGVRRDAKVNAGKNLATTLARCAALGYGIFLVIDGRITLGTLVAFLGYVGSLFGPVQGLTGAYQTLRRGAVSLETIFSILDARDGLEDAADAVELPLCGDVEFRDVSFHYGRGPATLSRINLEVRAGQTVALVGESGAGKTTFIHLLQRLYDPTDGAILLDGVDLKKLKQRSVRLQMGAVLQENMLFNDTIGENIAFGRPAATHAEIERAARAAHAHGFIMALPDGYDTVTGASGSRLSSGQKQRIAIARALLKDPPILILDEATSALDVESERLVTDALARLCERRTTFVVAHRLATVVRADRILVLSNGTIAESGTHADLMAKQGLYASLVRSHALGLRSPLEGADGSQPEGRGTDGRHDRDVDRLIAGLRLGRGRDVDDDAGDKRGEAEAQESGRRASL
jgi:ATP-binding cassette subfamily B protein